uniref:Minor capsid protein P9 transmembrane helices domain-containing protein n=1 Tax=viral metagenome TaxID=1070528 RepID=A0A6C0KHF4_9ZZZZ
MKCEPFWLEHPTILFRDIKLLPKNDMNLEQQMNCITRLVIFVFLILYLLNYQQSILFLILSIIFIIILYYLQKNKMSTLETYQPSQSQSSQSSQSSQPQQSQSQRRTTSIRQSDELYQSALNEYKTNRYTYSKFPSYFTQQIDRLIPVQPDATFVSNNQKLVGGANPKTHIAPIIAPPVYEWNHWKDNDFVVPSIINERTSQDFYGSGYYTTPMPDKKKQNERNVSRNEMTDRNVNNDNYKINPTIKRNDPILNNSLLNQPTLHKGNKSTVEHFTYISDEPEKKGCRSCSLPEPSQLSQQSKLTNGDFKRFEQKLGDEKKVRYTGDVNETSGYDETNIQYNLPSNYASTNCQRSQSVSGLNNEIFTSIITPGVYYKNQIIEPIDSNIGISFEQQIPPRKITKENGEILYTAMDPKLYTPIEELEEPLDVAANYDVYDPRSFGYGTSYRGYTDKMTGQPRFYYDDVDSVRRPNYVTRTNIDHIKNVDTYGPIRDDEDTRMSNETIRETAENAFKDQTLDFRTDMMTRLMRKRNAEMWQIRMAPKTGQQKNFRC